MTRVIYIAGPYSAPNAWQREANIRRAEATAMELMIRGVPTICVHAMSRFAFGMVPKSVAIEADLALLGRCDGVLLVDGWCHSEGTKAEMRFARDRSMPMFVAGAYVAAARWARREDVTPREVIDSNWWAAPADQ